MAAERPRWTTLPPLDPSAAAAVLAPPWLPTAAADRLRVAPDAAAAAIPILLHGAPAGACLGVARGLHAVGARAGPLLATASVRPDVAALPAGATLYVDATRLGPAAALLLAAAIDDGAVWVVVAAAPGTTLPPALATRLEAVVADVPALTARAADVPALATAILARFAARAGVAAPALSAAAAASLGARPWPGDVAELEAVLARAWLRRRGDTVDVSDVELAPLPTVATTEAATDRATPGPHLELLLA